MAILAGPYWLTILRLARMLRVPPWEVEAVLDAYAERRGVR